MVKESWLKRYKAQLCAFAVTVALLLATVLGVGISARAETVSTDEIPMWVQEKAANYNFDELKDIVEFTAPLKVGGEEKFTASGTGYLYVGKLSSGLPLSYFYCDIDLVEAIDMGFENFVFNSNYSFNSYDDEVFSSIGFRDKKFENLSYRFSVELVGNSYSAVDFTTDKCKSKVISILPSIYLTCTADNMTEVSQLEVPEKEGYHFVGWYKDAGFTQPFVSEYVRGDLTLYPKYEINTYTVSFSTGYGSTVNDMTVEHGSTISDLPTSTRTGWDFIGWTTVDGETFDSETEVTGDINLYAKFTIKIFKVTFLNPDGTVFKEVTVNYGTKLITAAENAKIDYKVFYSEEGQKLAKNVEITENAEIIMEEMTTTEKRAEFMSRHFWLIWFGVALLSALAITAAVSITVAVKRR